MPNVPVTGIDPRAGVDDKLGLGSGDLLLDMVVLVDVVGMVIGNEVIDAGIEHGPGIVGYFEGRFR